MDIPFEITIEHLRAYTALRGLLGNNAQQIQSDFIRLFGDEAPGKTFVYKWISMGKRGVTSFEDAERSGRPTEHTEIEEMIREILEREPFSSTRSIECELDVNRETIRTTLITQMGMRKYVCKWVPHELTDEQKEKRISCASHLHSFLTSKSGLTNTITGDQAWFFFDNPVDQQWAESADKVQRNVMKKIDSKKVMLTIFWGLRGFYLIDVLPPGTRFNGAYFAKLLCQLEKEVARTRFSRKLKGMYLHVDNATPHRSREARDPADRLGLQILKHPPYSPDLAPTDFYLIGYLKERIKGHRFQSTHELIDTIHQIISEISREDIDDVMDAWIERLHTVATNGGEYIIDS
jgi:histone-lysine N-methyltransferase SETMAR